MDLDDELDATLLAQIKHAGHSRIPVQSGGGTSWSFIREGCRWTRFAVAN